MGEIKEALARQYNCSVDWVEDCLKWHGRVLTGHKRHWCGDWDDLPIDDTCVMEMECCTCPLQGDETAQGVSVPAVQNEKDTQP